MTKSSLNRANDRRRIRARVRKGECARPLCGHAVEPERTLCPAHAQANRDQIAAHRAARKAKGLCWRCSNPARPGGLLCEDHRRAVSEAETFVARSKRLDEQIQEERRKQAPSWKKSA